MKETTYSDSMRNLLPPGQDLIETKGIRQVESFVRMVIESKRRGSPTIGVVTGRPGIGKSVALQATMSKLGNEDARVALLLTAKAWSTPRELVRDILALLNEDPRGHSQRELNDQVVAGLARHNVSLLAIDEADQLGKSSLDLLGNLHRETGCALIIAGMPDILRTISYREPLAGLVGMRMRFPPCTRDEMLTVVLPQLVFPHWIYDPADKDDIAMGEQILALVGYSLRRLRHLLDLASQAAETIEEPRITSGLIKEACQWMLGPNRNPDNDGRQDDGHDEYKRVSDQRKKRHGWQPIPSSANQG